MAIIYLPLAVTALADALKEVNNIATRRAIRETDYLARVDALLLEEARGDPDETLTEAEFLISVLKSHGLVDEPTLTAIRHQFFNLTRHKQWREVDARMLDAQMVFGELVEHGRVRQRPRGGVAGLTEYDPATREEVPLVNLRAIDGGYREWRQYFWLASVAKASPTGELRTDGSVDGDGGSPWAGAHGEDDERGEGVLMQPPHVKPPSPHYLATKVRRPPASKRALRGGSRKARSGGRRSPPGAGPGLSPGRRVAELEEGRGSSPMRMQAAEGSVGGAPLL
jgi:hypothetical protein